MWRRPRPPEEPRAEVPARWRPTIIECDRLVAELGRLVASSPAGPLRQRLDDIRAGVLDSVEGAVAAAQRGGEVERLASTVDVAAITDAYKRARREADAAAARGQVPGALAASVASLARQHGSAHRLLNAADETDARLSSVQARLTEIVLSAGELLLGTAGVEAAEAQAAELAGDVQALREAFSDLS